MKDYSRCSALELRNTLSAYIKSAVVLASGGRWETTAAHLDSIKPDQLADFIKAVGDAYIANMTALRNAAPIVRGHTISITRDPTAGVAPNAPSLEDEAFLARCRKQLLERGFVLASDADTYAEIAKQYPGSVHPATVRGADARRFIELRNPKIVDKSTTKRRKK